jgi:integrase
VRFPKKIRRRGHVLATIYAKRKNYPFYRLAYRINGKRLMKHFRTYSEANREGKKLVKDLAKGAQVAALTAAQARDALAAFERLLAFYQSTGRRVSLLGGISEYCEAASKLHGRTVGEAVDGYLGTVASVKRKDVAEAVEEFIRAEEPRTKASDNQRAQLSAKYAYNRAIMLRRFASMCSKTPVCDLAKEHLDVFIGALAETKSKSNRKPVTSATARNHYRAAIRQFLQWAVRKDYLPATHRLNEADAMRPEHANNGEIEFYTPGEFKALLDAAEGPMRAMIALGGLAGLRTAELIHLAWEDVWRVRSHIEVTAGKAKTRQRRLVEIVPALGQWLAPCSKFTGKVWTQYENLFHKDFVALCEKAFVEVQRKKVTVERKPNGLRHAFCTYHFALHANENLTAQQAGNSPAMIHQHYKGLATKAEAEKWFAVTPTEKT